MCSRWCSHARDTSTLLILVNDERDEPTRHAGEDLGEIELDRRFCRRRSIRTKKWSMMIQEFERGDWRCVAGKWEDEEEVGIDGEEEQVQQIERCEIRGLNRHRESASVPCDLEA